MIDSNIRFLSACCAIGTQSWILKANEATQCDNDENRVSKHIATLHDPLVVSGISAMPSMHVAICVLFGLWVTRFRKLALTVLAWSYAVAIYIGSIHLGWHYATDGVVSAICVLAIWWTTGRYVEWLKALPASAPSEEQTWMPREDSNLN